MPRLLLITRQTADDDSYFMHLSKRYVVFPARSGKQGLLLVRSHDITAIVLDAASMRTTGERICRSLRATADGVPILHIHPGPRDADVRSLADVLLFAPVTPRRLMNSVGRLLHDDEEEVLKYGPFAINVPRRILVAYGKEHQLTPKQAALVELFLRHPGETLERQTFMEKVWGTDYMGDTRTLDVHIRWLRKIMEADGRPRYLMTVRGVGYCLEIPEAEELVR